ncbi:protein kinase [Actinophytocola sp. NPDC049390]|uniref:WD40 repeat domain-containing serine/threonine protein kinase n=1 Tax=Actinophytocola sp. NPDC049390 TaxID=3363894 RepID=UPI00379BDA6D
MEWARGEVILGLYEVLDVVHSGGMGVVHRVRHRGWQVDMAVKTPRPALIATPRGRELFEAEAGTWVGLGLHPHTVNCAYVRTIEGVPRVFAEWVDGGSLAEAVHTGGLYAGGDRAALARVLDIAVQSAWGLAHAHDAGLVHQDVKPANIMLDADGTAKVTDFGLAKARAAGESERPPDIPLTASFGGLTPAYCSPEQAAAAGDPDVRLTTATDVWSWAVTVLEMFAGRRPSHYGQAAAQAMETVLADARLTIPPAVVALLRQCFAADPAARPARFDELATSLAEVHGEVLAASYGRPPPKPVRLLSDGLSNQALSLLDLGRAEEAEQLWRYAIGNDPHHLPSVYNFGLHRWRTGRQTGEELVSSVEAARALDTSAHSAFLLGAVQLERHEDDLAGELLREAAAADPDGVDVAAALTAWREREPRRHADHRVHEKHTKKSYLGVTVSSVATSADGGVVLTGDRKGGLVLWRPGERGRRAHHTLARRGSTVDAVGMDAAGTLGVAVRRDGFIELWDLRRGRARGGLMKVGDVRALAVSGDGRYVAAGNTQGLIVVATPDDQYVAMLQGHTGGITSLALSWDGRRAVSASFRGEGADGDGTVRSWDVFDGSCTATLTGPARAALPMDVAAVSTDARYAVVAWWDGPLVVWDARRATVVSEVPHRWRDVTALAVAGAGPTAVTAGDISVPVEAWNPTTGRSLRVLDGVELLDRQCHAAAVSADGRVAVLGSDRGRVLLRSLPAAGYEAPWCYVRPRAPRELTSAEDAFRARLAEAENLTERSRFAAAATALRAAQQVPGFARHPDLRAAWARIGAHGRRSALLSASPLYHFDGKRVFTQPPTLAMRKDGLVVATGRWTGEVDVWDFAGGERLHVFDRGEGGKPEDIQFAVADQLLAVRTNAGTIRQLDLASLHKHIFTNETGHITAFAVNPDGDRILIGDENGTLRLRNLPAGAILRTLAAHGGRVDAVAISPDGRYAATRGGTHPTANHFGSPGNENEVHLWPADADRPAWTLTSRSSDERLDFSADGETLFLSSGLFVGAWDVHTGKMRYSVRSDVSTGGLDTFIAFDGDHRLAATRDENGLRVWDTATGKPRQVLTMPESPTAYALSADGSFVVTGGFDRLLRIWDVQTGQCLRTLEGHRAQIHEVTLSRDGTLLASTDFDSTMWAWGLAWDFDFPGGD